MAYGIFLGGKRAKAMFNGSRVTFKGSIGNSGTTEPDVTQLTAPTISLDGDILTMTATDDRTEEFVIFVDGVETATVANGTDETYTVSGTWYFNETITSIPPEQNITFVSNGQTFNNINTPDKNNIQYDTTIAYSIGAWANEAYRTITFDGTQTVSKEFYEWLTVNAVRQSITFTIDGTSYTALSGMTWGEWVASEYNTGGFNTSHNGWHICATAYPRFVYDGTNFVEIDQTINAGTAYTIKTENMMPV